MRPLGAIFRALVWLIPALLLGWPRADTTFFVALAMPLLGAAIIAQVTDVVSLRRKDGEDGVSERRIAVALLLAIVVSAFGFGRALFVLDSVRAFGVLVLFSAYFLRIFAMATNRFFSGVLIVQNERSHTVCDRGPYRFVRHPGNLSAILISLSLPPAIGSLLGAPFAILGALVVLDRTRKEERFLASNLAGYDDYSRRVRFRLLPGIY